MLQTQWTPSFSSSSRSWCFFQISPLQLPSSTPGPREKVTSSTLRSDSSLSSSHLPCSVSSPSSRRNLQCCLSTHCQSLATRLKSLNLTSCSGVNSIRILSVSMYFCTIAYIVSTGILISSWDFRNEFLCKTAVYLCLTFFIIDKIILYLFLVERSHQLRSHLARRKDWMYILGVAIVIIGFGTIAAGFVFADNVTGMSKIDGKCRIRLPLKVTLPFLFYDVCINVLLAVVFFSLCSVHIRKQPWRKICNFSLSALSWRPTLVIHRTEDVLVFFMVKSLLGAAAVIIPTIGSLAILFYLNGHEQAWICLTMCTVYSKPPTFEGCIVQLTFYSDLGDDRDPLAYF